MAVQLVTQDEISAAASALAGRVRVTPMCDSTASGLGEQLSAAQVCAKFEQWQRTGTFKVRGALLSIDTLDAAARARGVTAVSAGNHAVATAYAAHSAGVSAKLVMTRSANAWRIERCWSFGAELVFADDVHSAFETVAAIQRDEGRSLIHPFNSKEMVLGSATLGLEIVEQCSAADYCVVPVGGGGLIAGIATAIKVFAPSCKVIGVEPVGADSMTRSLAAGEPQTLTHVASIADSLGAPFALPYSYAHVAAHVDGMVQVADAELRAAMQLLHSELGLAVEPACAATTAAALGPLRDELAGQRAVLVFCGSNIDADTFKQLIQAA